MPAAKQYWRRSRGEVGAPADGQVALVAGVVAAVQDAVRDLEARVAHPGHGIKIRLLCRDSVTVR
jgi:hypothetical protein